MDKIKVLVISGEVWQDGTNGGNVLTNMFEGFDWEFSQIYCNPGNPQNNICKSYFQFTDGMVIRSFLKHKPIGKSFKIDEAEAKKTGTVKPEQQNKKFDKFFHKFNLNIFHFFRNVLWNMSNWKNDKLKKFIDDFNPDIIFAPCYGNKFMLKLTRFVAKRTGKKIISYYSDDAYTLNQFNLSLFYWINRLSVRKQLKKTFPYYSLCYTMTKIQKEQCEKDFHANMKLLLKPVDVSGVSAKNSVSSPIRIVYAGGLYLNRWKTLLALKDAIKKINVNGANFVLDIYTASIVSKRINRLLNDGYNCFLHPKVSKKELFDIYGKSDIALHVESFDLKNRLTVRMSFSTKITDCLSSGCAVMAICDEKQGGFEYLKNNDLAICIDCKKSIERVLKDILQHKEIVLDYANKALEFSKEKHNANLIRKDIYNDFMSILNESFAN